MKTKISLLVAFLTIAVSFAQEKKWTLKECVDYALENNLTIKRNEYNLALSKENIVTSKGKFLPNLNASSGTSYGSGFTRNSQGVYAKTDNISANLGASAGGTIFDGFRNLNSYKQSKIGVKSSQLDLEKIKADISLNIINTYLNVLFAKENLNAAKVQAEISAKQIERAQSQVEAGTKAKGELLNAQSSAISDAQNVVSLENTRDLALLRLAQILQIDVNGFDVAPIEIGSPSASMLFDNSTSVYENALKTRPEIAKAKLDVESAELGIKIAKGTPFLPNVSYSLNTGTSYFNQLNNLPPGLENDALSKQLKNRFNYGAGISFNLPIFNGFQTKSNVSRAKINKNLSELNLEGQKLQLRQTIEQAFLDAKAAAKSYEAAQKSLEAQKEAFKNAQERYNYGAMTLFDFDQVRNRFVNAESALIRAKYDYVFKTKVLKFYNGESVLD